MQCLYCEAELKPFRGLFDEDFCCREHRDKYLSSFRKSLTRLPSEPAEEEGLSGTRLADFREIALRPAAVPASHRSVPPKTLTVPYPIELSKSNAAGRAALVAEERPAGLVEEVLSAPGAFRAAALDPPRARLEAPCFRASYDGAALLPTAEFAELTLLCRQLVSTPVSVPELALAHAFQIPVFEASRQAMEYDDTSASDVFAIDGEAAHAEPDPTSETELGAAPLSVPVPAAAGWPAPLAAACSSEAAVCMAGQPVPISVPALATGIAAQPRLAPEMVGGVSHKEAANQAAEPHTHGAMHPSFWSSVRIKNWRLRITFAKPA